MSSPEGGPAFNLFASAHGASAETKTFSKVCCLFCPGINSGTTSFFLRPVTFRARTQPPVEGGPRGDPLEKRWVSQAGGITTRARKEDDLSPLLLRCNPCNFVAMRAHKAGDKAFLVRCKVTLAGCGLRGFVHCGVVARGLGPRRAGIRVTHVTA